MPLKPLLAGLDVYGFLGAEGLALFVRPSLHLAGGALTTKQRSAEAL